MTTTVGWLASDRVRRALAPLAALLYPGIIWCGPRLSPLFLAAALLVPVAGWNAAARLGERRDFPIARLAAHLTVAAPPLFGLLGGWLDFQRAIPLDGLGVWIPLWLAIIVAVLREEPTARPPRPTTLSRPSRLAVAHGVSALVIALFVAAHLANQLGGLAGGETHKAIMRALRAVYRDRLVEPVLLAAVAFQVASGLWLLRGALARVATRLDTLQTATGAYMLLFFASHVSAVLRARLVRGTDTNWDWLAGGELLTDPWSARLGPYYFLAVVAFGLHAACGLRRVLVAHGMSPARGQLLVVLIGLASTAAAAAILVGLLRA